MNASSIVKKILSSRWQLVFSIVIFMILSIGFRIANPLIIRHIIDDIVTENPFDSTKLVFWTIIVVAFSVLGFIFDGQRVAKTSVFGSELTKSLAKQAYSSFLRSELMDLNKIEKDKIIQKITSHSQKIGKQYFEKNVIGFLFDGLLLLSLFITMMIINPWFGLLTLLSFPLFYTIINQINKFTEKRQEKMLEVSKKHHTFLYENVNQIKKIKLLNGIEIEETEYNELRDELDKTEHKLSMLDYYNYISIQDFITGLLLVGFIGLGSWLIVSNEASTIGAVVASISILPRMIPTFRRVMEYQVLPHHVSKDMAELNELLLIRPENRADTVQQLDEIYSLKFKDVYFDYGMNTKFNIEDINFEIKKGEKLGILGLSNSGKTTLVDLILKIIRPKQGSILINNCDVNKVNTYYLRDLFAIAPQQFQIMKGTIEQNIIYPFGFDEYKYNDALNRCRLKPFIYALPKKEQTIISEDSDFIKASDKQRIAIANALYKDAKMLIFDDATSKMSQEMEKEIVDEIYKLKNKMLIFISNRIYNLQKCDKILILNNGRVIEYGKTEELLNDTKSTFARLIKEQDNIKVKIS